MSTLRTDTIVVLLTYLMFIDLTLEFSSNFLYFEIQNCNRDDYTFFYTHTNIDIDI